MFSPFDVVLFGAHIGLWTAWTLLIRASRGDSADYPYHPITAVITTEATKFLLTVLYVIWAYRENSLSELQNIASKWRQGIYFAVPALIYGLYNYLFYFNLVIFDPTSYRVLINLRILWSGLLFQAFFSVRLGLYKWVALVVLLAGCGVNQMNSDFKMTVNPWHLLAIGVQSFASSLGGVYNEFLLKKDLEMETNAKNMYMYVFSMLINYTFAIYSDPKLAYPSAWYVNYTPVVWVVILLGAVCGLSTALFLKYLNVILKEYAHTGELFLTAFLSYFLFSTSLNERILVSIVLSSISVVMYNRAPATPVHLPLTTEKKEEGDEASAKV